jgi:nitronate monooxygenase
MGPMALSTAFTEMLGIRHPIALAPMGGSAGAALAAAVSNAGALGLLGGGPGSRPWLERELPLLASATSHPWGVGFQSWSATLPVLQLALDHAPRAVMLSFGDPAPFIPAIRQSAATLIIQVTDLEEARQAIDLGADLIVAQGTESGGHGATRGWATLPFVPVVADLAAPIPVLAAGGIADGRGVAAALALGAAGALIGTRFQATAEALVDPVIKKAIVDASGEETERSTLLDIARLARPRGRASRRPRRPPGLRRRRRQRRPPPVPRLGRPGRRAHHRPPQRRRPSSHPRRPGRRSPGPSRHPPLSDQSRPNLPVAAATATTAAERCGTLAEFVLKAASWWRPHGERRPQWPTV